MKSINEGPQEPHIIVRGQLDTETTPEIPERRIPKPEGLGA